MAERPIADMAGRGDSEHEPEEDWDELAREVRAHLRAVRSQHLRERQKNLLFYVYVVALFGAFYVAPYTGGLLQLARNTGVVAPLADRVAPALPATVTGAALLALLAALADGLWRGPVVLDPATTGWLLPAPAAWGALLTARLRISLATYAASGAVAALAAGFLAQIAVRATVSPMLVAVAAAGAALGLVCAAVGTLVERHDARVRERVGARAAARLLAGAVVAMAALTAWHPDSVPSALGTILLWSGPWGWAAQPVVAAADSGRADLWPVALLLLVACAALGTYEAHRAALSLQGPVLRARVGSSRGVLAAVTAGDLRQASLSVRSATSGPRRAPRVRVPAPRAALLVVPWRSLVGWVRAPGRVGWAVLALGLAYVSVGLSARVDGAERALTAVVSVFLAYAAAGQLLEAARVEADDVRPSRSLPLRFPALMLAHGVAPVLLLLVAGGVGTAVTAGSGGATGAALGLLVGTPGIVAAGLAAASGGPLPVRVMTGNETAMGNTALVGIVFWYARAPLAALVVALPPVLIGAATGLSSGVGTYVALVSYALVFWARWAAGRHYAR